MAFHLDDWGKVEIKPRNKNIGWENSNNDNTKLNWINWLWKCISAICSMYFMRYENVNCSFESSALYDTSWTVKCVYLFWIQCVFHRQDCESIYKNTGNENWRRRKKWCSCLCLFILKIIDVLLCVCAVCEKGTQNIEWYL